MADEPSASPPVEMIPSKQGGVSAIASANAPLIYFEFATAFGTYNHIVHVTLEANRFMTGPNGVASDSMVVAHLRMNLEAAMSLRAALEKALAMAASPQSGQPKH